MNVPNSIKIRYMGLDFSRMSKAAKQGSSGVVVKSGVGAGTEWNSFEQSLGHEILDTKISSDVATKTSENRNSPGNTVLENSTVSTVASPPNKLDVLKELKNVAAWTINETSFFCKYGST